MHGYQGRILKVDLARGVSRAIDLPEEWVRDFAGGDGLGLRLYWDLLDPGRDLLAPAEPLIFCRGCRTEDASGPAGATLVFRSPDGGAMAAEPCCEALAGGLERLPWDALVIGGRSRRPALLHITDESAELLDVTDLWGASADLAENGVREVLGDEGVAVASAGPLGPAAVGGSVSPAAQAMAAKNLKAVAVRGCGTATSAAAPAGALEAPGRPLAAKRVAALRRLIDARLAGREAPLEASELLALGLEWTAERRRRPMRVH